MGRTKEPPVLRCSYQSYDLDGWEGGIAVCAMDGPSGTKIIAVPRLGLSTCLTGPNDSSMIHTMLTNNRTLNRDRVSLDLLKEMILKDFAR